VSHYDNIAASELKVADWRWNTEASACNDPSHLQLLERRYEQIY